MMINNTNTTAPDTCSLMTHIVAGYPNFDMSYQLIKSMVTAGVACIEIQLPFSDPLGDGSSIMQANQYVLDKGVRIKDCFDFIKEIRNEVTVPLLIMSYANIPYRFGIKKFLDYSYELAISGYIIPDIPYDEEEFLLFHTSNIPIIPVISPNIEKERLQSIALLTHYLLYCTLRIGITGAKKSIDSSVPRFLHYVRKHVKVPIIGGFGISSIDSIKKVSQYVDFVVLGSHIINILHKGGISSVQAFLHKALNVLLE